MLPDEIGNHIEALDQWLEEQGKIPKPFVGLSAEERKQLQTVNKAVDQLQRAGVDVPDDLRRLKLKLSAQDATGNRGSEVESRLKSVEKMIQALGKSIKKARTVRDSLNSTGPIRMAKKHYGISLRDLLRAGLLSTDDRLELQWLKNGPVLQGKVRSDGSVTVKTSHGWQSYASLSAAASQVAGQSLNGWKHWCRISPGGQPTALAVIRDRYLKEEADG